MELEAAAAAAVYHIDCGCDIVFFNHSLDAMIAENDLSAGSVSTIIDLSGLWFTTDQSGNDQMREMLLSILSPVAVLYTTMIPILNSWMRLLTNNGKTRPLEEFVSISNRGSGSKFDDEKIYKIAIRRALEGHQPQTASLLDDQRDIDNLLGIISQVSRA